jgi:hypothetical protein
MASGGPEDVIEATVCNKAEAAGWLVRKVSWPGRRAAMDHVFVRDGRTVWIEFKAPGKEPDELQRREIGRFLDAGADVYVIDNVRGGLRVLGLA